MLEILSQRKVEYLKLWFRSQGKSGKKITFFIYLPIIFAWELVTLMYTPKYKYKDEYSSQKFSFIEDEIVTQEIRLKGFWSGRIWCVWSKKNGVGHHILANIIFGCDGCINLPR